MTSDHLSHCKFYGAATVGPKGQIVIPAEARANLGLKPGDKVIIVGTEGKMLGVCPASQMEKFLNRLGDRLSSLLRSK